MIQLWYRLIPVIKLSASPFRRSLIPTATLSGHSLFFPFPVIIPLRGLRVLLIFINSDIPCRIMRAARPPLYHQNKKTHEKNYPQRHILFDCTIRDP